MSYKYSNAMNSITVSAHAKVNLFLKVLSKRKDSYHNILTLFERISLADTIRIFKTPKKGIIIKSDKPITRSPKDNLVYKAAQVILKRGRIKSGVIIKIKKRIPLAAGLGGGSSDAAATLIGINKLFKLRLSTKALIVLGRKLGADVPFFLLSTPFALAKDIGDNLNIIKAKTRLWHVLIYPGFKLSTKDVYRVFDASAQANPVLSKQDKERGSASTLSSSRRVDSPSFALTGARSNVKIIFLSDLNVDYDRIKSMLYNDLEKAAVSKKKVLGHILKSLAQLLGRKFIVSGSGPSLFCLYSTGKEALEAKRRVLKNTPARQRHGWQVLVVQTA